ncbi:Multiple RNA-binding domain-containing protein 1 [Dimargaris xerosporica]|nr:Multiple RNA-binding domain-containing protein 1 [Dimargaris xerosporica]
MSTRIIVKNLPKYATDDSVRSHFAPKGEITDCKLMRNQKGESRRFAYIGFRTEKEAKAAVRHFNETFMDTTRILVEMARPIGDADLPRPWSVYSKGSSAFERKEKKATTAEKRQSQAASADPLLNADLKTEQSRLAQMYKDTLNDSRFHDFLKVMQPRALTRTWADNENAQDPGKPTAKVSAQVLAVPNKKSGGAGLVVTKSHVKFADSDDEYEDLPVAGIKQVAPSPSAQFPTSEKLPISSDNQLVNDAAISDMDYLRSRMSRSLLEATEDSAPLDPTAATPIGDDSSTEPDAQPLANAPEGSLAAPEPLQSAVPDSDAEDPMRVDTKHPNYNPFKLIMDTGRLFVRNLPYSCTEHDLQSLFEKYGPLSEVHMPIVKDTKKPKGFAYVLYLLPEHAVAAFKALDAQSFQGRVLHILPARDKITPKDMDVLNKYSAPGMTAVKQKKELERKSKSGSDFNWNSLYMSHDAILDSMAERLGISKGDILDPSASNPAVRVALAETHVVNETKQFLEIHGLALDAFAQKDRSDTVILVKNIPFSTTEDELRDLFGRFGELGRVLIPPAKTIAVIEYLEPTEARVAFRHLAYKRFKGTVIYLEKAPIGVFKAKYDPRQHGPNASPSARGTALDASSPTRPNSAAAHGSGTANAGPETAVSLFIKNLSFETTEEKLQSFFNGTRGFLSVAINRKPDPKRPGQTLSMGFGFAKYNNKHNATKALKTLQGLVVDGYAVKLKLSTNDSAESNATKRKAGSTDAEKSNKLMVRNVPFEATTDEVHELFSAYGEVKSVRIPKKFTGGHRGFAFVEYLTVEQASRAKTTLENTHLYGRHLVIEFAKKDDSDLADLRAKAGRDLHRVRGSERRPKRQRIQEYQEGSDLDDKD